MSKKGTKKVTTKVKKNHKKTPKKVTKKVTKKRQYFTPKYGALSMRKFQREVGDLKIRWELDE